MSAFTQPLLELPQPLRPLTESVVNNRIQRLAKEAGIDITPHGLRRTCATLDLNQHGLSVDMVRLKLGHTDIKTTQGYLMTDEQALIDFVRGKTQPPTPIEPHRDFVLA